MKTVAKDRVIQILEHMRSTTIDQEKGKALDVAIECVENWYAVMEEILN